MWRATWKGLLGHKLRMALTGLAIVLGVGFVAGSYIFTDTLGAVFDDLFAESLSGIDVQVRASFDPELGFALPDRLPEDLLEDVRRVDGVAEAVPTVGGLFVLVGQDGEVIGGQGPPTIGGSWADVASPLVIREGRPPEGPGEIVLDSATARNNEIEVGDEVGVISIREPEPHRVVGLVQIGGSEGFGGATFAAFEFRAAQEIFGAESEIDTISILAEPGVSPQDLIDRLTPLLGEGVEAVTAQTAAEEQLATFKDALGFLNTFLLVFGFVALFVGAFLIQNTFQIVVAQRTRELALLRAIGATRGQVTRMVITEGLLVSLAGGFVGVGAGFGLATLIRQAFETLGGALPSSALQLRPRTLVVAVGSGVLITLFSTAIPARRAGRVPPVAAMREAFLPTGGRPLRAILGGLTTAVGAGLVAIGLTIELPTEQIPEIALVGAGAGVVFIGLAVLAPSFARPLARSIGYPLPRLGGAIGKLAQENAVRSPRRTAATASALMIGVALVGLVTIMAASIRATTDALVEDRFRSDLIIQPINFGGAGLPPALADRLEELPEIDTVTRIRRGPVKIGDEVSFLGAADLARIAETIRFEVVEGSLDAIGPEGVAISTEIAERFGWSLGDRVNLAFRTGEAPFTVRALFVDEGPTAEIFIPLEAWDEHYVEPFDTSVFIRLAPGVAGRDAVEAVVDDYPGATVLDQTEFRDQAVSQLDAFVMLIFALLALALVIGFVGIMNTLLLSVYERTREIGLLRAIGTTRRQMRRMVTWESVVIAVFGAVVGTATGVIFGWAVVVALGDGSELVLRIPIGQLTLGVLGAATAGVIAAIYPARRASRMNILEAIAYE